MLIVTNILQMAVNTLPFFFNKKKSSFITPGRSSPSNKLSSLLTQNCSKKSIIFYSKFWSNINSGPLLATCLFRRHVTSRLYTTRTRFDCTSASHFLPYPQEVLPCTDSMVWWNVMDLLVVRQLQTMFGNKDKNGFEHFFLPLLITF